MDHIVALCAPLFRTQPPQATPPPHGQLPCPLAVGCISNTPSQPVVSGSGSASSSPEACPFKAELLVALHGVRRTHSGHQMQREREREIESQREGDGGAISAPSRRVDLGTRYAVADRLAHKESEKNRACGAHELPCAKEARVKAAEGAPRKMFASMTSTRHLRSNTAVLTLSVLICA